MSSKIDEGQPLLLQSNGIDSYGSFVTVDASDTAGFDYWEPGYTEGDAPDGTWNATFTNYDTCAFQYQIPADILTIGTWKRKPFVIASGYKYYGNSSTFKVYNKYT